MVITDSTPPKPEPQFTIEVNLVELSTIVDALGQMPARDPYYPLFLALSDVRDKHV